MRRSTMLRRCVCVRRGMVPQWYTHTHTHTHTYTHTHNTTPPLTPTPTPPMHPHTHTHTHTRIYFTHTSTLHTHIHLPNTHTHSHGDSRLQGDILCVFLASVLACFDMCCCCWHGTGGTAGPENSTVPP